MIGDATDIMQITETFVVDALVIIQLMAFRCKKERELAALAEY